MSITTLRARYVFPVTGDPIADGSVTIAGGRIVSVGRQPGDDEVCDLGNVAILPGLVNAHVHLDFSDLVAPLGRRGVSLADWIRLVMEFRREAAGAERNPVARGVDESLHCGVTTLGDIAQPGGWPPAASQPINVTVFQELIAPGADRLAGALELARSHLKADKSANWRPGSCWDGSCTAIPCFPQRSGSTTAAPTGAKANWRPGLNPHAPYSVHPSLLAAVVELSMTNKVPVAMHLAESQEELELLRHGAGPLRDFLEELGAWDATTVPRGTRPIDYLRLLASSYRALVVHGNYLDDEEIGLLAANSRKMSVAYCPRTHDWFAHGPYPLEKMLAAGATVALGTDGRCSSPDLSLLEEMRFAARRHSDVGLDHILKMGTIFGARALGWEAEVGSLEPGKRADLAIVALPDRDAADPHELLFHFTEPIVACYYGGKEISNRG